MTLYDAVCGYKTLSIIGMCKNAGKTTAVNDILGHCAHMGETVALTSIGRDGESQDIVTGTKKPGIYVAAGTLIATAEGLISECDITKEIIDTTDMGTPLGDVVLLRALSDGFVQIGGPSMTDALAQLNARFFEFGADRVIIDGALSRKTLCAPSVSEGTVLCTGASYSADMDVVISDTVHAARLLSLDRTSSPKALPTSRFSLEANDSETDFDGELLDAFKKHDGIRRVVVRGALTDAMLRPLLISSANLNGLELTVEDGSKLLLSADSHFKLGLKGIKLTVLKKTNLAAITVNPLSAYEVGFDKDEFLAKMRKAVNIPVFDVLDGIN